MIRLNLQTGVDGTNANYSDFVVFYTLNVCYQNKSLKEFSNLIEYQV